MAGNSVIGALRVVLGADTAALDKGLKDAQSSLERFGTHVKNAGLVMAGALAGALGGLSVAMKGAIENADKLGKMAQSVGIPVEELSALKHAADLSDVSMESLAKSMGKLSKAMVEVAGGSGGKAKEAFDALGISVRNSDGTLKSASVMLGEIAEKFKGYEDGAAKTALAMAIFGKAGAGMIPLLNAGKAGLQEMTQEAQQLGIVIDNKTAKSAEAFNDNLTRLGKVKEAFVLRVTQEMLPALQLLSQRLIDSAKNSTAFGEAAKGVATFLQGAVTAGVTAALVFQRLGAETAALWNAFAALGTFDWEKIKAGFAAFNEAGEETKRQFANLKEVIGQFWNAAAQESQRTAEDTGKKIAAPIIKASEASQNALESFLSSTAKRKASMQAELQTIGMSAEAQEALRIKLEALTIAKEKDITVTAAMRAKIDEAAQSYGAMKDRLEDARKAWGFVENSIGTVASGLTDVVMRTKTAGEAFRDMALSIVRDFLQMIIKAQLLKAATAFMSPGGGGFNFFGADAGLAAPKIPGFANGGSFVVGGAGGIDSQLAMMRVTPGERVSVSKDGSSGSVYQDNRIFEIDARGATPDAIRLLNAKIDQLRAETPNMAVMAVSSARVTNPGRVRER